jgi:hypothetical protein
VVLYTATYLAFALNAIQFLHNEAFFSISSGLDLASGFVLALLARKAVIGTFQQGSIVTMFCMRQN